MSTNSISLTGQQLLESSAGTGKTYTITHLYLRLLLGRGRPEAKPLKVQEILVLTFTIAATQELKDRIRTLIATARNAFQTGQSEDPDLQNLMQESDDLRRDQLLLCWLHFRARHGHPRKGCRRGNSSRSGRERLAHAVFCQVAPRVTVGPFSTIP